jgi:thiol-disulfide isomerase/thioredoxin
MKTSYFLILILCFFGTQRSFSQQGETLKSFTLIGRTNDKTLDSVSIIYINGQGKIIQESVAAVDGNFQIKGLINQPTFSNLVFKHKGEVIGKRDVELKRNAAYLNPGEMTISKVPSPNGYLEIANSPAQLDWKVLYDKTKAINKSIDSLNKLSGPAAHGDANAGNDLKLKAVLKSLKAKEAKISFGYFIANPSSYVTADRIKYYTSTFGMDSIKQLYNKFSPELKESTDGKRLAAEIKSREVGLTGTKAFAFNVKDKDEKELSLSAMKGKYVLLDFWATWCVPCRASMPQMINLYKKYKDKNFVMIGIGDDDRNVPNWLAAIEKDGTNLWPQTLRGLNAQMFVKGIDNPRDLGQQYGVRALPTKILIDPNGKIIGRFDGQHSTDEEMEKMLAQLLNP